MTHTTLLPKPAEFLATTLDEPQPFLEVFAHVQLDRVGATTRYGLFDGGEVVTINRSDDTWISLDGTRSLCLADPTLSREHLQIKWSDSTREFALRRCKERSLPAWLAPLDAPFAERPVSLGEWTIAPPGSLLRIGDRLLIFLDYQRRGGADCEWRRARSRVFERVEAESEQNSNCGDLGIVGRSAATRKVRDEIGEVARGAVEVNVLISGETGVGKEGVARAIHELSAKGQPFVATVMANEPNLLESQLFGHVKGAFTGAVASRIGLFEEAREGTVLFDELGDLPPESQPKLLRVLQERTYRRVGGVNDLKLRARVLSATWRELEDDSLFRRDLYFRLSQVRIHVSPLRERKDDLPLLFVHRLRQRLAQGDPLVKRWFVETPTDAPPPIPVDAIRRLLAHSWPGNTRELVNLVQTLRTPEQLLRSRPNSGPLSDQPSEPGQLEPNLSAMLRQEGWRLMSVEKRTGLSRRMIQSRARSEGGWPPSREEFVHLLEGHDWSTERLHKSTGISKATLGKWREQYAIREAGALGRAELERALASFPLSDVAKHFMVTERALALHIKAKYPELLAETAEGTP